MSAALLAKVVAGFIAAVVLVTLQAVFEKKPKE